MDYLVREGVGRHGSEGEGEGMEDVLTLIARMNDQASSSGAPVAEAVQTTGLSKSQKTNQKTKARRQAAKMSAMDGE